MKFSKEEVEKLANLAKLKLSDQEIDLYQKQVEDILAYVDKINKLNLADIKESLSGIDNNDLKPRSDKVEVSDPQSIKQAGQLKDDYMVAPKVFDI
ncbi:Asp-tRNA(Asn)/Glu-tRNA(Gln) amidotransferase GatCAB subunit C [Candidatus Parcubacteria bacterium]|nr:MAG: Asp-tRNA(Asn)/Glu-tRNA(Gln) amidotransferase GatCAB subunit C [Candidatus Parcubacteria bacterium]